MKLLVVVVLFVALAVGQHHPTGKWVRTLPSGPYFPRGRYFHVQAGAGNAALIFGGATSSGSYLADLFQFNIEQGTTTLLSNGTSGPSARFGACAGFLDQIVQQDTDGTDSTVIRNQTFVVFGGYNGVYLNDLWAFNLGTLTWTQISESNTPSARAFHSCAVVGGAGQESLFVFGGTDGTNYFNDVNDFNQTTQTWTTLPNNSPNGLGPSGRAYISGIAQGGDFYFFGGFDGSNCNSDTWAYSAGLLAWFNIPTAQVPPSNAAYAGVEFLGNGYDIFGGYANCQATTSDLEAFSHSSKNWQLVPPGGIAPPPRAATAITNHGNNLLMYAGADGSISGGVFTPTAVYDDLWYYIV